MFGIMRKCSVTHGFSACVEQEIITNDKLNESIYMKIQQNNMV